MPAQQQRCQSSGLLTIDTAVLDKPGRLVGATIINNSSNATTLTVYDNASAATGTVVCKLLMVAADKLVYVEIPNVHVFNGLYADIDGTSAEYILYYS